MGQKSLPTFLGLADCIEPATSQLLPGPLDIYQISIVKVYFTYPVNIQTQPWLFHLSKDFLENYLGKEWHIEIYDDQESRVGRFSTTIKKMEIKTNVFSTDGKPGLSCFFYGKLDAVISRPGRYSLRFLCNETTETIGDIVLLYEKLPPLSPDQITAIASNPNHYKVVGAQLGCKFCPKQMTVYAGLERSPKREKEGWVWYGDIQDEFKCTCGKTAFSLHYLKENMHSMLLVIPDQEISGLSYVRQYGHAQITAIAEKFKNLIVSEDNEQPIQKFLEKNPLLFARFHAKRLFIKPQILGQFEGDFALIDSENQLWFIELERPSIQLFKKDGHPTQNLMHAYNQVVDWTHKFNKHRSAVLETLKLKEDDVLAVRGIVIAGRKPSATKANLERHMSNRPYPQIEFLTLDDLWESLLQISKKLA